MGAGSPRGRFGRQVAWARYKRSSHGTQHLAGSNSTLNGAQNQGREKNVHYGVGTLVPRQPHLQTVRYLPVQARRGAERMPFRNRVQDRTLLLEDEDGALLTAWVSHYLASGD